MGLGAFLFLAFKMRYYEISVDWSEGIGSLLSGLLFLGLDVVV